jgi:hypothetical protein
MTTSNPGILGVLVKVGSASLTFRRAGGTPARGERYMATSLSLIAYISGCLIPKTDMSRTANIAKLLAETTVPLRGKVGAKALSGCSLPFAACR